MNSKSFRNILRTYCVPGSIPGVRETAVNKTGRVPTLTELMAWGRGSSQLQPQTVAGAEENDIRAAGQRWG